MFVFVVFLFLTHSKSLDRIFPPIFRCRLSRTQPANFSMILFHPPMVKNVRSKPLQTSTAMNEEDRCWAFLFNWSLFLHRLLSTLSFLSANRTYLCIVCGLPISRRKTVWIDHLHLLHSFEFDRIVCQQRSIRRSINNARSSVAAALDDALDKIREDNEEEVWLGSFPAFQSRWRWSFLVLFPSLFSSRIQTRTMVNTFRQWSSLMLLLKQWTSWFRLVKWSISL